jgi:hypothetical protein
MMFDLARASGMVLGSCPVVELGAGAGITCSLYNFGPETLILMPAHSA